MNPLAPKNEPWPVMVFMRAPQLGRVKTRLARKLAPQAVLALYRCFVADTLAAVTAAGCRPILCVHPPTAAKAAATEFGSRYEAVAQEGAHLGERMANAFYRAFSTGHSRALLVGVDIPHLPARIYREAFDALARHPAVIGPATDGGYYLIGFNRNTLVGAVFDGMPWGTDGVFERTCEVLAANGVQPYRLPPYRDLDTVEDVVAFSLEPAHAAIRTRACLNRIGFGAGRRGPV